MILLSIVFSIVCGLFFVRFLIPFYFMLFPPIHQNLNYFYIALLVSAFLTAGLAVLLFVKRKDHPAIWLLGAVIILFGFGVPIFMIENNEAIWREAIARKIPAYLIDFSPNDLQILNSFHDFYRRVWDRIYWLVDVYIAGFIGLYYYLGRKKKNYKKVRVQNGKGSVYGKI
jgi:ABC-type multidrug transport system permease subunit